MIDHINGNKFAKLAHFVICPPEGKKFTQEILKQNAIIFSSTNYIDYLFDNIKFSPYKYILITHASDYTINYTRFFLKPNCIVKWFAENGEYEHEDLIPIPLGVENTDTENGCIWGQCGDIPHLSENEERFKNKLRIEDTVFCAWRNITNPMRSGVINSFIKSGVKYYYVERIEPYKEYCEVVTNYRFVASPPGNGIDAHKTWEILYMGSIPIVLKNRIYKNYDLPILQVPDYSEVTPQLLQNYLEYYRTHVYNMEQLKMSYWNNLINNEFNKL